MKKFLMATVLVALSGTSLVAAPVEKQRISIPDNIPPAARAVLEKYKSIQKVSNDNPLKIALDNLSLQTKTLNGNFNAVLNKKGYLIGTPLAQLIDEYITQTNSDIEALRPDENSAEIIFNNNQDVIPGLIEVLNNTVPANAFPFKCYDYANSGEGRKVKGVIERAPGRTVLYFYPVPYKESVHYNFKKGQNAQYDVGLIGNGKEYHVTTTLPGRNVEGWLYENEIVCLGNPSPVH